MAETNEEAFTIDEFKSSFLDVLIEVNGGWEAIGRGDFAEVRWRREQLADVAAKRLRWHDATVGNGGELCRVCSLWTDAAKPFGVCQQGGAHRVVGDPFIDAGHFAVRTPKPPSRYAPCPDGCYGIRECGKCGSTGVYRWRR